MDFFILDHKAHCRIGPFSSPSEADAFAAANCIYHYHLHKIPSKPPIEEFTSTFETETEIMEDLPKPDFLIKILNMTTSSSDGESLAAIRKANSFLSANNWTWEALIRGKIKITSNPFAGLSDPRMRKPGDEYERKSQSQGSGFQPHQPFRQNSPPPPPPPPPPKPKPRIISSHPNMYSSYCFCCGNPVAVNVGFLFNPTNFNPGAPDATRVVCAICNSNPAAVPSYAATKKYGTTTKAQRRTPSLDDL